jgi:exopolysaccharide production protein ExoY
MSITTEDAVHPIESLIDRQIDDPTHAIKRAIDIVLSLALLLFLLPGFLLTALLLLIADGRPIFYSQTRVGRNGVPFRCHKFRSMSKSAASDLERLLATSPEARAEWEATQKLVNDPRVHKLGRFLRRSSIDEIPQLLNVVKGEMSLVGPRPVTPDELQRYGDYKLCYLAMTPGITGVWQVSGRSELSYQSRVQLDVDYFHNQSIGRDFGILVKTVGVCMTGRGSV